MLEPESQTQFEPHSDDAEVMWNVIAILKERKTEYLVQWEGIDPSTGNEWAPSWVPKSDCTNDLIREWKLKKLKMKQEQAVGGRISQKSKSRTVEDESFRNSTRRSSSANTSVSVTDLSTRRSSRNATRVKSGSTKRKSPSPYPPVVQPFSSPRKSIGRVVVNDHAYPSRKRHRRDSEQPEVDEEREKEETIIKPRKRRRVEPVPKTTARPSHPESDMESRSTKSPVASTSKVPPNRTHALTRSSSSKLPAPAAPTRIGFSSRSGIGPASRTGSLRQSSSLVSNKSVPPLNSRTEPIVIDDSSVEDEGGGGGLLDLIDVTSQPDEDVPPITSAQDSPLIKNLPTSPLAAKKPPQPPAAAAAATASGETSVGTIIPDSQSQPYGSNPSGRSNLPNSSQPSELPREPQPHPSLGTPAGASPAKQIAARQLRPIPRVSPSLFRSSDGPFQSPSQIEQFSPPETRPTRFSVNAGAAQRRRSPLPGTVRRSRHLIEHLQNSPARAPPLRRKAASARMSAPAIQLRKESPGKRKHWLRGQDKPDESEEEEEEDEVEDENLVVKKSKPTVASKPVVKRSKRVEESELEEEPVAKRSKPTVGEEPVDTEEEEEEESVVKKSKPINDSELDEEGSIPITKVVTNHLPGRGQLGDSSQPLTDSISAISQPPPAEPTSQIDEFTPVVTNARGTAKEKGKGKAPQSASEEEEDEESQSNLPKLKEREPVPKPNRLPWTEIMKSSVVRGADKNPDETNSRQAPFQSTSSSDNLPTNMVQEVVGDEATGKTVDGPANDSSLQPEITDEFMRDWLGDTSDILPNANPESASPMILETGTSSDNAGGNVPLPDPTIINDAITAVDVPIDRQPAPENQDESIVPPPFPIRRFRSLSVSRRPLTPSVALIERVDNAINHLKTEIQSLEMPSLRQEIIQLRSTSASFEAKLAQFLDQTTAAPPPPKGTTPPTIDNTAELESLRNKITDLEISHEQELGSFQAKIAGLDHSKAIMQKECDFMTEMYARANDSASSLAKENGKLVKEIEILTAQFKQSESTLTHRAAVVEAEAQKVKSELELAQENVGKNEKRLAELEIENQKLEEDMKRQVEDLNRSKTALQSELEAMAEKYRLAHEAAVLECEARFGKDLQTAKDQTEGLIDRLSILQAKEEESKAKISELEATLEAQAITFREQQIEAVEFSKSILQHEAKISELEATLEAQAITSREQIEALQFSKSVLQDDLDDIRALYQGVSETASAYAKENHELTDQNQILKSQATVGIKQSTLHVDSIISRLTNDVTRWKGVTGLYREQCRRMDDKVRQRAAREPKLVEDVERLEETIAGLRDQLDDVEVEMTTTKESHDKLAAELEQIRLKGNNKVYLCMWRSEDSNQRCRAEFKTREELQAHFLDQHV